MKVISLKCPECGASLSIEEGRTQCFCQYCGTKIMLDDERSYTKTIHTIDDAKIRQAEINREIQLKKMEIEEKKDRRRRIGIVFKVILSLILGIVGGLAIMIGLSEDAEGVALFGMFCLIIIGYLWIFSEKQLFKGLINMGSFFIWRKHAISLQQTSDILNRLWRDV